MTTTLAIYAAAGVFGAALSTWSDGRMLGPTLTGWVLGVVTTSAAPLICKAIGQ